MKLLQILENAFSGMLPFILLMLLGLYLTVKGDFFQFKKFPETIGLVMRAFKAPKPKDKVTSFQSACTALSATVGTGNIAGVAGAVSIGGAGAVFWMCLSAFMGMAVKFAEIKLAIIYRQKELVGGPTYYIKNGLGEKYKILSVIFAAATIPASLCSGNMVQVNAAVSSIGGSFFTRLTWGVVFTAAVAIAAAGGIKRIGAITEKLVPLMSVLYVALSLGIIFINREKIPSAISMIFEGAFNPEAVTGGAVGSLLTTAVTGASRGVFSNEAGIGTSAMAHSVAFDADSETQGLFGIFEVFIDTVIICSLTALTILTSGVNIDYGKMLSSELVGEALKTGYGGFSALMLSAMMVIFAFSSIIGWAVYGNICWEFLFGAKSKIIYMLIYPVGCILGALCEIGTAWRLSALFNGIMLCVNVPAIWLLSDNIFKKEKRIINAKGKNIKNSRAFGRKAIGTYR